MSNKKKFKVGDRVKRVGANWSEEQKNAWGVQGQEYDVKYVTPWGDIVVIEGQSGADPEAFELVKAVFDVSTVAATTSDLGTNPKDLLGIKKVQLNLVPASSTIYQALAMEDGAIKYGPFNWRKNRVISSIYVAAAKRHIDQWFDGQEFTEDSKVPNLGAALACLGIIVDAKESGNLVDDRPPPGPATKIIVEWAEKKKNQNK